MTPFYALVEQERGTAFGVRFPDVAGCYSAADDEQGILPNAIEALALHLEGENVPDARSLQELTLDPDVSSALSGGAVLLAVPLVALAHQTTRANLSFDRGTLVAIDAAADMRGMNRSAFLAEAALNEIKGR